MLTKITLKNFKSFKDEIEFPICQKNSVVSLIGRNASGKSTIFEALYNIKQLLAREITIQECYKPFIGNDTKNKNCEYGLTWKFNNIEYSYFISFNGEKIEEESLRNGNDIFVRNENIITQNQQKITLPQPYQQISAFFLLSVNSVLTKSDEKVNSIETIYRNIESFLETIFIFRSNELPDLADAVKANLEDIRISRITSTADPTLLAVVSEVALQEIPKDLGNKNKDIRELLSIVQEMNSPDLKKYKCVSHHVLDSKIATLNFQEESDGTKKLFRIAPNLYEILDKGGYLFIDELDSHLHPAIIAKVLIPLFSNSKTNPNKAKLIFSMHNLGILLYENFRRYCTLLGLQVDTGIKSIVEIAVKNKKQINNLMNDYCGVTPIIFDDGILTELSPHDGNNDEE